MLNPNQEKAVYHPNQHLLIIAGPGTGKTHALVYRIVEKVKTLSKNQKVLAITFTHKAADEMRERLERLNILEFCEVETFHSFCLKILKKYFQQANLAENFNIFSPENNQSILQDLWPSLNSRQQTKHLENLLVIKSRREESQELKQYSQLLRKHSLLDYEDLLIETVKLFESHSEVLSQVQLTYPYVFVDEYQDINFWQHRLLTLLVGKNVSITAIGDPQQAIYGFRGANLEYFNQFKKDFPLAEELSLNINYRSASNLLKASSQVIEKAHFPVTELTAHMYKEGKFIIHQAPTEASEAEYVVKQIDRLVGGLSMFSYDSGRSKSLSTSQHSFGDIAIIFRLHAQRKYLEEALDRSGIPYGISGEKNLESQDFINVSCEKVNLLSMHASKGLEFPVVFIVGAEEHLIPLDIFNLSSDIEEERRLFYVAMTRAKEELYITSARKRMLYGQWMENDLSVFVKDIADELKQIDDVRFKKRFKEKAMQLDLKF